MSVTIEVRNDVRILGISRRATDKLRRALTYENLEYTRRKEMGSPTGSLTPTFSTLWTDADGGVRALRGVAVRVSDLLAEEVSYVDRTVSVPVDWPEYRGKLRKYQSAGARALELFRDGLLLGPCGSGKTEILLAAAARTGQRTIVVVDSRDLQRQWQVRARSRYGFVDDEVGIVGGIARLSDKEGRILTIATAQTLRNRPEILDGYGCLVADEVHLWAAETMRVITRRSPSRYRMGGTATLQREDGLVEVVKDSFGPVVYEITEADLNRLGFRQEVEIALVPTDFYIDMRPKWNGYRMAPVPWNTVLDEMIKDVDRKAVVVSAVTTAMAEGRTLVLSESRRFAWSILREARSLGYRVHSFFGGSGRAADCLECGHVPESEKVPVRIEVHTWPKCDVCGYQRKKRPVVEDGEGVARTYEVPAAPCPKCDHVDEVFDDDGNPIPIDELVDTVEVEVTVSHRTPTHCSACGAKSISRSVHNERVKELLDAGMINAAAGTSIADKGLDIPRLERAVAVLPSAGGRGKPLSVRFKQQLGRLARPDGDVEALLYYIWDRRIGSARDRADQMREEYGDDLVKVVDV